MALRRELQAASRRLYDAATPEHERTELSMAVAILRQRLARAERRQAWTPDAIPPGGEYERLTSRNAMCVPQLLCRL
jgi:hypothetical protein